MDDDIGACVFSKKPLTDGATVCLREKGSATINCVSIQRKDSISTCTGMIVHTDCRRNYIHPRNILKVHVENNDSQPLLRSKQETFDFKTQCLFCAQSAKFVSGKRGFDVFQVRSLEFQQSIIKQCETRNDKWSEEVKSRLSSVIDLPAAEGVYHQTCSVNFRTFRQLPKSLLQNGIDGNKIKSPAGRRENIEQIDAFAKIVTYIQCNTGDVITVKYLVEMMSHLCGDNAYSIKHMKRKLLDYFGDSLIISSVEGKSDVLTFRETVSSIIQDFFQQQQSVNAEQEKTRIILTAAKLIKSDISVLPNSKDVYPSFSDISSVSKNLNYLPSSLQLLLDTLFSGKDNAVKIASIGQAVVQSCKPKNLLAPLQLALGVQLHHQFGSRYLIDLLNSLGFSASYHEVNKFECSAAAALNTTIPLESDTFIQFVADNVDHNLCTLDGNNTFHGMGIIATATPGLDVKVTIPRIDVSFDELKDLSKIDIHYFYNNTSIEENSIRFMPLPRCTSTMFSQNPLDFFYKVVWPLSPNRPCWSGFMQLFESGKTLYPGTSSVTFMPMLDINPSDLTCIYSTLCFVCEQARSYGVDPVVTFDQPLYHKAMQIVNNTPHDSPLKNLVLRLGGFHTEMSFLGCIGHLMSGSGLQEVLETVYAPTTVTHMMSGKAVYRALRGHTLLDTVLHTLLLESALDFDINSAHDLDQDNGINTAVDEELIVRLEPLKMLSTLYDQIQSGAKKIEDISIDTISTVQTILSSHVESLKPSRTACLWFQYLEMIKILQEFMRAERTGDWVLHLNSLTKMLPFFASAGHNLYLKSAYLYLQEMKMLGKNHPKVEQAFLNGKHVVRRSDRYWAGLSTDLVIEQVLMRSVKTSGGLTRGRGMSEQQRSLWLMSRPASASMNNAMQEFSNTSYITSDQHKEVSPSRIVKDNTDIKVLYRFLKERNPFQCDENSLRNIETGMSAEANVNVEMAKALGEEIVTDMEGKTLRNYVFKRNRQTVIMSDKAVVDIAGENISLDTQLIFQRLTTAAMRDIDNMPEIFAHELCSIPSSLFDNNGMPREANKAALADTIWKLGVCTSNLQDQEMFYVVDGGSLLQKIPWCKGSTFASICSQYKDYLLKKYTQIAVVFDGYSDNPSTKDVTHIRRSKGAIGTKVTFSFDTPFRSKKESFMKNKSNKQNFISLLTECFRASGIIVHQAHGDADCLIVKTALDIGENINVTVIGEDTDLLVLLLYHTKRDGYRVFFRSDCVRNTSKPVKLWDIKQTQSCIGRDMCRDGLFIHALTGCDSTSRIFGISKAAAVKTYRTNDEFRSICRKFSECVEKNEIIRLGEAALLALYHGLPGEDLNQLRYRTFTNKVIARSTSVQVHSLPPTSSAAAFHSLRVYHQLHTWA